MTSTPSSYVRKTEIVANISIILLAILAAILLVKRFHAPGASEVTANPAPQRRAASPPVGTPVELPGVDWRRTPQTLLLVLSSNCHFCTDSAPFYRRLAATAHRTGKVRLVAVLPQPKSDATQYLDRLGLQVDSVFQATVSSLGARGTPTLVLVNDEGVVTHVWTGRVQASLETEILALLGS